MTSSAYEVLNHPLLNRMPENNEEWQEYNRLLLTGPLGKISDDGRIADERALSQNVLGSRTSVQLTAALTGIDDAGVPTITIDAHDVTYSFGVVTYNAATLVVPGFETIYYVYRNDPLFLGGDVEYMAYDSPDAGVDPALGFAGQVETPALGGAANTGGYGGTGGTGTDPTSGNPWP